MVCAFIGPNDPSRSYAEYVYKLYTAEVGKPEKNLNSLWVFEKKPIRSRGTLNALWVGELD
jgi:hypothetical protein